jgi:hypothetical protein
MALGLGYGLPFSVKRPVQGFSEDVALSVNNALADAAQREEAGNCLAARAIDIMQTVQTQPSLLIVPQLYKAGVLYDQLPTTRTNFIPNNSMAGATGSVLPTTWASGSIPAGFTFSVGASGQATANDGTVVNYVDVSVSGTATASGTFNLFFSAATGAVTATTGQTFTLSAYATCISGDITTPAMVLQVQEVSGSTFQAGTSTNIALASGAALQRVSAVRTFNQSGVTAARGRIGHPIVSGTTYNYTIRIGSPQLERLSVPTPMIATSTGAVTRLNESTDVVGLPPEFSVSRNTTATRVNSSGLIESVASGVPRIDWLGQSCPGLLVEASGQNQALWSRDLSVSGTWAASGITAVRNAVGADGAASGATTLTSTAASATITQNISHASQSRIFSAYMRRVSGTGQIQLTTNGGTNWQTVTLTSAFAPFNSGAQTVASGQVGIRMIASGDVIEVDFTQAEIGPVATSPITTTSGAVSRAADVISASGALVSSLIGQTEGTIYAEFEIRSDSTTRRLFGLSDGTQLNRVFLYYTSNALRAQIQSTDISLGNPAAGYHKVAFAYQQSGVSGTLFASLDGGAVVSGTAGTFPSALKEVFFGKREDSADTQQWNARIRAAALYTTRLTDAQLAELTRL